MRGQFAFSEGCCSFSSTIRHWTLGQLKFVVAAARDSLAIDRAYRDALASAMLEIPE
jgi:hypothetical protein